MSLRGRVIRRRPYACFITPMSAQQEEVEFVRYSNMFRASPSLGYGGSPQFLLPRLARFGWYLSFPYPSIYSETLAAKWDVNDVVWVRIPSAFQFSSYSRWTGTSDPEYRALVVIDKSNPSSPTIKKEQIFSFSPSTAGYDIMETVQPDVSTTPYGIRLACMCEGSNTFVTYTTGALADTDEVWCVLFFTQDSLIEFAYGTFFGPTSPSDWLKSQRM